MRTSEKWDQMTDADWTSFAASWLEELHSPIEPTDSDIGQSVVFMNFTATPAQQWKFIVAAVACAKSDEELGHLATGPMEHLLGHYGENIIAQVEDRSKSDSAFARMLTGVWKYMISDEVWKRIQAIQAGVKDPLDPPVGNDASGA
jgi:hypothetical protein